MKFTSFIKLRTTIFYAISISDTCLRSEKSIWQADVKWRVDDGTCVRVETGNRIPIWLPSVFLNRK